MRPVSETCPAGTALYSPPAATAPYVVPLFVVAPESDRSAVSCTSFAKKFTPGAPIEKLWNFTLAPWAGAEMIWTASLEHAASVAPHARIARYREGVMIR